jgi:hypothetical protein
MAGRQHVSRSTRVMVIDIDSGAIAGKVPNTKGVPRYRNSAIKIFAIQPMVRT